MLKDVRDGRFGRLLGKATADRWFQFVWRRALTPGGDTAVLRLHMETDQLPWYLWAVYRVEGGESEELQVRLDTIYVPAEGASGEELLEVPEDLAGEPYFAPEESG